MLRQMKECNLKLLRSTVMAAIVLVISFILNSKLNRIVKNMAKKLIKY